MDLKIISWNVEHFTGKKTGARAGRVQRVVNLLKDEQPDIFALMEVQGAAVYQDMIDAFPGWSFAITEGKQVQEILLGWRSGLTAFMTQRNEFRRGNLSLRPAALLTVSGTQNRGPLSLLFSHLKSFPTPEGYGLRDGMIGNARSLKKAIDEASDDTARFILLGDLNTMGLNLTFSKNDLSGTEEIERIDRILAARDLVRMPKTHPATFNNGSGSSYPPADLDHVYASNNCEIADVNGAKIRVAGWAEEATVAEQDTWIAEFSDHAPLIFTIENV